jgi:colanic acid/amylovoran biosynthesis glycosyltransferase
MNGKRTILIFRNELLPRSETFVRSQAEALQNFEAHFVGARLVRGGLQLPADKTLVVNTGGVVGRIQDVAFQLLGKAPRVQRAARQLEPSLLHAHFGTDGVRALPLAQSLGVPLVVSFHGFDATTRDDFARRSFRGHRRYIARRGRLIGQGALFIAVSEFVKRKLIEQGYPEERIVVHYTGVDTAFFQSDASVMRRPVVLFVGRLVESKGCEYAIRAVAAIQNDIPGVELVVIGDGPLRSSMEELARRELRACSFLGALPPDQVRHWMNVARVFCVPSITTASGASEGFGMVFAEAQSMGLPVVSFATGGIPEAVAHEQTGVLSPQHDCAGLADGVRRMLNCPSTWERFSQNAQKRSRERFDLRKQTAKLEALYEDVLASLH